MTRRPRKGERARKEAEEAALLAWDADPELSIQIAVHASQGLEPPKRKEPRANLRLSANVYRRLRLAQLNSPGNAASVSAFVDRLLDVYEDMSPVHDPAIGEMLDLVATKPVDVSSAHPTRLSALYRALNIILNTDAPLAIARNLPFDVLQTAYAERAYGERVKASRSSVASIALRLATGDRTTLQVLEHELSRQARQTSRRKAGPRKRSRANTREKISDDERRQ